MGVFTYDEITQTYLGTLGRYQLFLATIASLDPIPYALYTLSPVFIASTPPHSCAPPDPSVLLSENCTTEQWQSWAIPQKCTEDGRCEPDSCRIHDTNLSVPFNCSDHGYYNQSWKDDLPIQKCDSWTYGDSFYPDSAVREWDLVCDKSGLASTISGAYMLGRVVGCLMLGFIADRFGRRRAILLMTLMTFSCALASAFVTNVYVFLVLRFAIAVFDMARSNFAFILGVEILHSSRRAFFSGYSGLFWVFGSVLLAPLAYFIRHWRSLLLASAMFEIPIFIIELIALPESPRWLLLKQRKEEVRQFIEKTARYNKRELPQVWEVKDEDRDSNNQATVSDLLKAPWIALMVGVMSFIFFANSFVFYGLTLNTSNLAGNEYLNFFISGAIEFPAYTLIGLFYERSYRKPPYSFCLLSGGVLLFCTLFVPADLGWVVVVLSMLGKGFITLSFMVTWLVVTEIFPTAIRGLALGITNSVARLASFCSAYVNLLVSVNTWLPVVIFSVTSVLAGLLILVVPETRGITLPQTVQDGNAFIRNNFCKLKRSSQTPKSNDSSTGNKQENDPL